MAIVYVVGAGLAGLAAATAAAAAGRHVVLLEMARHAGGRCRTFHDPTLDRRIDNGNHLILSGNGDVTRYLDRIGGRGRLIELAPARFPFVDLTTGERWTVAPNAGPVPWWLLAKGRRPKGADLVSLLRGAKFLTAGSEARVADLLPADDPAFRRFWEPLAVGVLNTRAEAGAATLLRPVLLETFAKGEAHCRPLLATTGLGDALVEPAVEQLRRQGASVHFGARVEALSFAGERVTGLRSAGAWLPLEAHDALVLATPPWATAALVPGLTGPMAFAPILNVHFKIDRLHVERPSLLGVIGGLTQWVFRRHDVAAVTVSAAEAVIDEPADRLAASIWPEVRTALELSPALPVPPFRLVKERRATPVQTPRAAAQRWQPRTAWSNLTLAGDWTATGLPATIESAVRSGHVAAQLLMKRSHAALQQEALAVAGQRP
ncbi:MAG: FAD-binding protein [Geminicoccaceae bacterium]|nr:MAG: FAD-binding protein [Geminicoccaceae bacterium]